MVIAIVIVYAIYLGNGCVWKGCVTVIYLGTAQGLGSGTTPLIDGIGSE
ncbi:hypothetical protein [Ascidiimonas aurantiaca]